MDKRTVLELRLRVLQRERRKLAAQGIASARLEKKAREVVAQLAEVVKSNGS